MIVLTIMLTMGQTIDACVTVVDRFASDPPSAVHLVSGDHWYVCTSPAYVL